MIAKLVGLIFLLALALAATAAQHSSEAILSSAPTVSLGSLEGALEGYSGRGEF